MTEKRQSTVDRKTAKLDFIFNAKTAFNGTQLVKLGRNMLNLISPGRDFQHQFICQRINKIEKPSHENVFSELTLKVNI
jgi:uncharacterized membrane protein